jgi:hypothetical protein
MSAVGTMDLAKALMRRVVITSLVIAAVIVGIALILGRNEYAISLAAGAAVAMASFAVLAYTVAKAFSGTTGLGRSNAVVLALGFLKLGLLGAALWWLVSREMIEPITFLAGFSSVVVALLIEGIRLKGRVA